MSDRDPDYFPDFEIASCAAHVEVKQLANKLYRRWLGTLDRPEAAVDVALGTGDAAPVYGLCGKAGSIRGEFENVLRGLRRCCVPVEAEFHLQGG